jgi:hypothetical protein
MNNAPASPLGDHHGAAGVGALAIINPADQKRWLE